MKVVIYLAIPGLLLLLVGAPTVFSVEPKQIPKPGPALEDLKKPPGVTVPPCSELKASLTLRKRISGNRGIIELHGQVCNTAPVDYNSATGAIARMEVKDSSSGTVETLGNRTFKSLAKGNCIDMTATYTIDKFISWDEGAPAQKACRGERYFAVFVAPAQGAKFPQKEDCTIDNNVAREVVKFWIECAR